MERFPVFKTTLPNGLTILTVAQGRVPRVSTQLWYHVGSKDEKTGQKGIAHFIEHMIFKGTEKLSESDINLITQKMSGSCNAFTSYDYTGYLFDFPTQSWKEALPIMADCMRNCTFEQQFLNSEVKAVIQELKMYNDDYLSTLMEKMLSAIFVDHPYHYPVIGFKHDLFNMRRPALVDFYRQHYTPSNATLVVVGDVDPVEVVEAARREFGSIEAPAAPARENFTYTPAKNVERIILRRDVQAPIFLYSWVVPGARERIDYVLDCLTWVLGAGKGSRLHARLVDGDNLASDVSCFVYDLFDHSVLFIQVDPYKKADEARITEIIMEEIAALMHGAISLDDVKRAARKTEMYLFSLQENNQKLAYVIGKYYTALGDENYISCYTEVPEDLLPQLIKNICSDYLQPKSMIFGSLEPMDTDDRAAWLKEQEQSDKEDQQILATIIRDAPVVEGSHVHHIVIPEPKKFEYPEPHIVTLKNGLKVFYYHTPDIAKIELIIDFQAKYFYDPVDKQGLMMVLFDMLQEGTRDLSAVAFAQQLESLGMTLGTFPGVVSLSMLSRDIQAGLSIIADMLFKPLMDAASLEKVKARMRADIDDYWDSPQDFIGQLVKQAVYNHHPYHKSMFGTRETVNSITLKDVMQAYHAYVTSAGARLVMVGDLTDVNVVELAEHYFGDWKGAPVTPITFAGLKPIEHHQVNYPINRDQTVIAFATLGVRRIDKDYDALLLFDQVFTGGVLGSMGSRLFELRERSGLFYTIGGSLVSNSDQQPGIIYIKTIVSPENVDHAIQKITELIDHAVDTLNETELTDARNAIINAMVDNFATLKRTAATFLFMDTFNITNQFFIDRYQELARLDIPTIQSVVRRHLKSSSMVLIKVGRI